MRERWMCPSDVPDIFVGPFPGVVPKAIFVGLSGSRLGERKFSFVGQWEKMISCGKMIVRRLKEDGVDSFLGE